MCTLLCFFFLQKLHKPLARWVCRSVQDSCGLDLQQIAPVDYVHLCDMPILFLGVEGDTIVPPECVDELFNRHPGYSELLRLSGSHNGQRTQEVVDRQMSFLAKHMRAAARAKATAAAGASKRHAAALAKEPAVTRPAAAVRVDALGGSSHDYQQQYDYADMCERPVGVRGIRVSLDLTAQHQSQQQQQQQCWNLAWQVQQQQQQDEVYLESQSSLCSQASSTAALCTVVVSFNEGQPKEASSNLQSSSAAATVL
jgi:hypothetical protein